MLITRVRASNWRNFQKLDIPLGEFGYLVGPSGSGKSGLLDIFRFLGDICREGGGGLQGALRERGGLAYVRSLLNTAEASRKGTTVSVDVEISERAGSPVLWRYHLALRMEGQGRHRDLVASERIWHKGRQLLSRPAAAERKDVTLLTQTVLEQSGLNARFRELADFFATGLCLLPVFDIPRYADKVEFPRAGTRILGYGLMDRVELVQDSARNFRTNTISRMMQLAWPDFSALSFWRDEAGIGHLEAAWNTYRQKNLQTDDWFTDDMLRLTDFFWSLLDDLPLLLVEQPEKYLPDALLARFPAFLVELRRLKKDKTYRMMPQVILTTGSSLLLGSAGIDPASVIVLEAGRNGTVARTMKAAERSAIAAGATVAEALSAVLGPEIPERLRFYK